MGKSLKNGVSPDEIYRQYGADTLRVYEMGMGPIDADRPWRPDDIAGAHKFLQRLWRAIVSEQTGLAVAQRQEPDRATERAAARHDRRASARTTASSSSTPR